MVPKRFLWTTLQVQYLSRLCVLTDETVLKTLKSLPSGLDETYRRLLNGIDVTATQAAVRALNWLSFSARTLYIGELSMRVLST